MATSETNPPTIGRIVHYKAATPLERVAGKDIHAAIVTGVHGGTDKVNLTVFADGREFYVIAASPGHQPGQWSWPPRS